MSCSGIRVAVEIDEGTAPELRAQVLSASKAIWLKASVSSIAYTVTNIETGVVAVGSPTLNKNDCWSDTFLTDAGWKRDNIGYNFFAELPASYFITGDKKVHKFQVEIRITPASGEKLWAGIWVITVNPVYTDLS